jgi:hypothetical protein
MYNGCSFETKFILNVLSNKKKGRFLEVGIDYPSRITMLKDQYLWTDEYNLVMDYLDLNISSKTVIEILNKTKFAIVTCKHVFNVLFEKRGYVCVLESIDERIYVHPTLVEMDYIHDLIKMNTPIENDIIYPFTHICLFDRMDRMGSHLMGYIAQIIFAFKNGYSIILNKKYNYANSNFIKPLFEFIETHNQKMTRTNFKTYTRLFQFEDHSDLINTTSMVVQDIKMDLFTFFIQNIYASLNLSFTYSIPFDVDKTILVHLRLEDVAGKADYDGSISSNYYKNKIVKEPCYLEFYDVNNHQAPLSKTKLDFIINKATREFPGYQVILMTTPGSDTTFLNYNYPVIKSNDCNQDLYFLTMCKVTVLSRSTFALATLFYTKDKRKTYVPLWGHSACLGLDTIYDKNDKLEYFF